MKRPLILLTCFAAGFALVVVFAAVLEALR